MAMLVYRRVNWPRIEFRIVSKIEFGIGYNTLWVFYVFSEAGQTMDLNAKPWISNVAPRNSTPKIID